VADAPIVIQQPPAPVVAPAQSVFAQVLIGAVAGVVAWAMIEFLSNAVRDGED
jgi:hypothetical protein